MERNYEYRKRLTQVHTPDRRDYSISPKDGEIMVGSGWKIEIPADCGKLLINAAKDLQDYFDVSMSVSVRIRHVEDVAESGEKTIVLATVSQLPELGAGLDTPRSYRLICGGNSILVCGYDEAGAMQGSFFLEDLMNLRSSPIVTPCDQIKKPLYSPRMIHGGYGGGEYPDSLLCNLAHYGYDTIFAPGGGVNSKINDLIDRAEEYGIQVYAYSSFKSKMHPDDVGAEEHYESMYGALFQHCPKLKGLILVGESVEFPSKDPHTSGKPYYENNIDGLPTGKPSPGWWPCCDYPSWLELVKRSVRKYAPQADIVFWTYNWGYVEESYRVALINSLPQDISLLATFEMFEQRKIDGINTSCVDYTLSFAGPGAYFESEARAAKARGIRLYSMVNTGGNTWDFGAIPYEPAPYQWIDRYDGMARCRQMYGLCGLMESHTFGFWPSFICELAKWAFWSGNPDIRTVLRLLAARDFGEENTQTILQAWTLWSDGIRSYISTNEDQYGPCRIGPSYPLVLNSDVKLPYGPFEEKYGDLMFFTDYASNKLLSITALSDGNSSTISQRTPVTMAHMERCGQLFEEGVELLEGIWDSLSGYRREQARFLINIARYIAVSCRTTVHVKKWFMLKNRLKVETDPQKLEDLCRQMIQIGEDELENAASAIPLVQHDSRLGWESSMGYVADEYHIRWKLRQVEWVITQELPRYMQLARQ